MRLHTRLDPLGRRGKVPRPALGFLLLFACTSISNPAFAANPDPSAPKSLRVVSLNVAGLSKPGWNHIVPEQFAPDADEETRASAQARADEVKALYVTHLTDHAKEAADRNEVVAFATTEATALSMDTSVSKAGACRYLGSPYASVNVASTVLGPAGFVSQYQHFPCGPWEDFQGFQGNEILTNAEISPHQISEIPMPFHCHRLGAQFSKLRFGRGEEDWMWLANTHLSLRPDRAREGFEEIVAELKHRAGSDWDELPILIVGDFNLVADGYDKAIGDGDWPPHDICENTFTVFKSDHVEASIALDQAIRENQFVHTVNRALLTAPAKKPGRKIDYALIRNEPAGGWSYGHLLHPVANEWSEHSGQVWTDHLGIQVVIRRPAADQIWLLTH